MHIQRHHNLTQALKSILNLSKQHPHDEARVYLHKRLLYATYEGGHTTLLDLRGAERTLFKKLLRVMWR